MADLPTPVLMPLGDGAMLIRFADRLSDAANRAAIGAARALEVAALPGVAEIVPGLVSVMLRLVPGTEFRALAGEVRLVLARPAGPLMGRAQQRIAVNFDGEDVPEVAGLLGMSPGEFVERHNAVPLRVLATGFAPGFVYCGMHEEALVVPRRELVRPIVPAGTVLFAAGQTAIAATPIRTGWHAIGRTAFQNFDPISEPPTRLRAGDSVRFVPA